MTAVVGILNTGSAVISADSAVTVVGPRNQKVYNNGNKIFQLTKHHPVGIAVYNGASLFVTPWETIIKMYRQQLGKNYFDTITDYRDDFLKFIKDKNFFVGQEGSQDSIGPAIQDAINQMMAWTSNIFNSQDLPTLAQGGASPVQQQERLVDRLKDAINQGIHKFSNGPRHNGIHAHSVEAFYEEGQTRQVVDDILNSSPLQNQNLLTEEVRKLFDEFFFQYFTSANFFHSKFFTGLVFIGFGDKEIYPSCVGIQVAEVINSELRWSLYTDVQVTAQSPAAIIPFAQDNVFKTIINGVAPELERAMYGEVSNALHAYQNFVIQHVSTQNQDLANQLSTIDINHILGNFRGQIQNFQNNVFIDPIMSTVNMFSKEDLAEMAESLIYLTYMMKRFTGSDETVSKPVDVAVISKGDGFIWIKRKHYFDPTLNNHYFRKDNNDE